MDVIQSSNIINPSNNEAPADNRDWIERKLDKVSDLSPARALFGGTFEYQKEQYEANKLKSSQENAQLEMSKYHAQKAKLGSLFDRQDYIRKTESEHMTSSSGVVKNYLGRSPSYQKMPNDMMREEMFVSEPVQKMQKLLTATRLYVDGMHYDMPELKTDAIRYAKESGLDIIEVDSGMYITSPNDPNGQSVELTPEKYGIILQEYQEQIEREAQIRTQIKQSDASIFGSSMNRMTNDILRLQGENKSYTSAAGEVNTFLKNGNYTPEEMRRHILTESIHEFSRDQRGFTEAKIQEMKQLGETVGINWEMNKDGEIFVIGENEIRIPLEQYAQWMTRYDRVGADFNGMIRVKEEQAKLLSEKLSRDVEDRLLKIGNDLEDRQIKRATEARAAESHDWKRDEVNAKKQERSDALFEIDISPERINHQTLKFFGK